MTDTAKARGNRRAMERAANMAGVLRAMSVDAESIVGADSDAITAAVQMRAAARALDALAAKLVEDAA